MTHKISSKQKHPLANLAHLACHKLAPTNPPSFFLSTNILAVYCTWCKQCALASRFRTSGVWGGHSPVLQFLIWISLPRDFKRASGGMSKCRLLWPLSWRILHESSQALAYLQQKWAAMPQLSSRFWTQHAVTMQHRVWYLGRKERVS